MFGQMDVLGAPGSPLNQFSPGLGALDAMLPPMAPLPKVPAMVGIGVPSTLACLRPDIRRAEALLHAATANVGLAVASFHPNVALTGGFGLRSTDAFS